MCGREVLDADTDEVLAAFEVARAPRIIERRYNISPGYGGVGAPWIVRVADGGQRELLTARWWLIPRWWKKSLTKLPTSFNARAEDVAKKPMFRESLRKRRCLVPATGWYEFKGKPGKKESYLFVVPELHVFGFAGIYDEWVSPEGEVVPSFAIVTTEPNAQAAEVHDRMPLLLHPSDHARWLDPENQDAASLAPLLRPWDGKLRIVRASGYGNDPRHEGPQCVAPFVEDKPKRDGPLFER